MRPAFILLLLACAGAAHGADTIHRCVGPDGGTVYTDRACSQVGARPAAPAQPVRNPGDSEFERRAPGSIENSSSGAFSLGAGGRSDCVRRTDTLLFELRGALESQNVNRLAGVYDWAGKSSKNAAAILDRLGRIASRPLASVEFRYPESDPYAEVGLERPPANAPQRPIGVHIEQLAPGEIVPSFEEDLRLVRNADCWWVSF